MGQEAETGEGVDREVREQATSEEKEEAIEFRDRIPFVLQEFANDDETLRGHYLLNWSLVVEWMAPDGQKSISLIAGDGDGNYILPWTILGHLEFAKIHATEVSAANMHDHNEDG